MARACIEPRVSGYSSLSVLLLAAITFSDSCSPSSRRPPRCSGWPGHASNRGCCDVPLPASSCSPPPPPLTAVAPHSSSHLAVADGQVMHRSEGVEMSLSLRRFPRLRHPLQQLQRILLSAILVICKCERLGHVETFILCCRYRRRIQDRHPHEVLELVETDNQLSDRSILS